MVENSINDLSVVVADEDGVIITDGKEDRCYIYFSEIPSLIPILQKLYDDNR